MRHNKFWRVINDTLNVCCIQNVAANFRRIFSFYLFPRPKTSPLLTCSVFCRTTLLLPHFFSSSARRTVNSCQHIRRPILPNTLILVSWCLKKIKNIIELRNLSKRFEMLRKLKKCLSLSPISVFLLWYFYVSNTFRAWVIVVPHEFKLLINP